MELGEHWQVSTELRGGELLCFGIEHEISNSSAAPVPATDFRLQVRVEARDAKHHLEKFAREVHAHAVGDENRLSDSITIKSFVRWCVTREYLQKNPLAAIKLVKPAPRATFTPTVEEVAAILRATPRDMRAVFAALAMTGLRVGELRMLRPDDVRTDDGFIYVVSRDDWTSKTRQSRRVPIHSALHEILQPLAECGDPKRPYFFSPISSRPSALKRPIYVRQLTIDFQRIAKSLKLPIGRADEGLVLHSFRHFFETECVNAGVPQLMIDRWMGHTGGKSMASVYYAIRDKESQAFISRLPFGRLLPRDSEDAKGPQASEQA